MYKIYLSNRYNMAYEYIVGGSRHFISHNLKTVLTGSTFIYLQRLQRLDSFVKATSRLKMWKYYSYHAIMVRLMLW